MTGTDISLPTLSPAEVKSRLAGTGEIALLDVGEAGQYGEGHPFLAVPLPYSRLELDAPRLLPCRRTPLVLIDRGDGVAERAARRLAGLGHRDISLVEGGTQAWAAAGFTLYKGVHVPSKTFGELVEEALETPHVTAEALARLQAEGADLLQLDGRPIEEFRRMTVPGARCCPNAELAHRLPALAAGPETTIVVNCAGRTRSIIGAETLRLAGVANPVFALENGTQGWVLAGLALEHGAERCAPETLDEAALEASRARGRQLVARHGLTVVDESDLEDWAEDEARSFYCLDVRSPAEFAAGHHPLASSAPGGQLVQGADQWIAVRGARIALVDDTGLRAALTAIWLRAMGHEVYLLDPGSPRDGWSAAAPEPPRPALLPEIAPSDLDPETVQIVDLRSSTRYRQAHIAGAIWSIRPRLGAVPVAKPVVLTAETPEIAALAVLDLREAGHAVTGFLPADVAAWQAAGLQIETSEAPGEAEAIDFLSFVHDRHEGNLEAMRGYLAWETGLIGQLDEQERAVFDLGPLVDRAQPAKS